ncbi:MAG: glycosyltransferase [Acetobacteraceae bacterium]
MFQTIRASVAFCRDGFDAAKGDVVVATGWQTVARALNAVHFRTRCYLVQDFEASFHAMGSRALMAEWTYTQDLGCICAGPWLARTLRRQFGRWTRQFDLALEHEVYYPSKDDRRPGKDNGRGPRRSQKRIVLYARSGTARRAVELALLALEHLAANGADIHVDLFGEEDTATRAPFPCVSHGILNAKELAELYRGADIGICFSATNYSLVPQEMMACGLPVVEIDAESTRAVFPDGVVTFAGPHPLAIASDLSRLLQDAPRRRRQAAAALAWVAPFNWEASARAVERSLLERLGLRPSGRRTAAVARPIGEPPKVTVCIPTYNGGRLLRQVVARVRSQRAPWPFDMVIIDSSSTDGSIRRLLADAMPEAPPLQVATIAQAEFQHGRTRNLCADMARGELVAFLTQDALPADDFWLYNLVTMLERFPRAAGAFGRHVAWPSASPFVKRELDEHFAGLARAGLVLSRDTDRELWRAGDPEWRQVLHFFSDNNACLRRCIWQQVPYPELVFGEDQAWADGIIRLGYEKVYVPSAVVYHSHDHGADEAFARAETEAQFFAGVFGYQVYDPARGFDDQLAAIQYADTGWARSHGISQQQLERQLVLNEARLRGRASGARRALEGAGG